MFLSLLTLFISMVLCTIPRNETVYQESPSVFDFPHVDEGDVDEGIQMSRWFRCDCADHCIPIGTCQDKPKEPSKAQCGQNDSILSLFGVLSCSQHQILEIRKCFSQCFKVRQEWL